MTKLAVPASTTNEQASLVVTKAVVRAADRLGITQAELARILGISSATASRMCRGLRHLDRTDKPFELAVLFIRLYRALDPLVAGDDAVARAWMQAPNQALSGRRPLDLIQTISGLTDTLAYLDARRAIL